MNMELNPWGILVSIVVFIGVVWFITRNSKPEYERGAKHSLHKNEKYTLDINITLNAKPLLSNLKGLLPEGESIFSSFELFNESKDSKKKDQETGGQTGGD
jgi:hypothetical protein